jgi:hypothetical protein
VSDNGDNDCVYRNCSGPSGTVLSIMTLSPNVRMAGTGYFATTSGGFGTLVRFEWCIDQEAAIIGPWRRTRESARSAFFEDAAKSDRVMDMLLGKVNA